jgi:hypothetical protein
MFMDVLNSLKNMQSILMHLLSLQHITIIPQDMLCTERGCWNYQSMHEDGKQPVQNDTENSVDT